MAENANSSSQGMVNLPGEESHAKEGVMLGMCFGKPTVVTSVHLLTDC